VRIAIAVKAVFDASVFVRAGAYRSTDARTWTARIGKPLRVVVPDLVWLEIASALRRRVTVAGMAQAQADAILATARRFPLRFAGSPTSRGPHSPHRWLRVCPSTTRRTWSSQKRWMRPS